MSDDKVPFCPRRRESSFGMETGTAFAPPDVWQKVDPWGVTCSWCGSIKPEDFLAAIRQGIEIVPTDKDYKAYVTGGGKFYFQHLDEAQRQEFIKLYNDKTMKVGYPGYFYTHPFFTSGERRA